MKLKRRKDIKLRAIREQVTLTLEMLAMVKGAIARLDEQNEFTRMEQESLAIRISRMLIQKGELPSNVRIEEVWNNLTMVESMMKKMGYWMFDDPHSTLGMIRTQALNIMVLASYIEVDGK